MEIEFKNNNVILVDNIPIVMGFNILEPMEDYQSYSHLLTEVIDRFYQNEINIFSLAFYPIPLFQEKYLSISQSAAILNILTHHCRKANEIIHFGKKDWIFDEFLDSCQKLIDSIHSNNLEQSESFKLFEDIRNKNFNDFDLTKLLKEFSQNYDIELLKSLKLDLWFYIETEKEKLECSLSQEQIDSAIEKRKTDGLEIPFIERTPFEELTEKQQEIRKKIKDLPPYEPVINLEKLLFPFEFYSLRLFGAKIQSKLNDCKTQDSDYPLKKINSTKRNRNPNKIEFEDLFNNPGKSEEYLFGLMEVNPELISDNFQFIGKNKGGWFTLFIDVLKSIGEIKKLTDNEYRDALNKKINGLNLDGSEFRKTYKSIKESDRTDLSLKFSQLSQKGKTGK